MRVRNVIEIGGLLQQRRKDLDLTQAEVAERAGVSRDWVVSIENGRRSSIEVDRLLRTLDALGLEIEISPKESAPTAADRAVLATLSRALTPGRSDRFGADPRLAAVLASHRETFAERFDSGPLARQLQESALVRRLGSDDRRVLVTALQAGLANLRDAAPATESNERLRRVLGELSATESLSEELRHALQSVLRSAESQAEET